MSATGFEPVTSSLSGKNDYI